MKPYLMKRDVQEEKARAFLSLDLRDFSQQYHGQYDIEDPRGLLEGLDLTSE